MFKEKYKNDFAKLLAEANAVNFGEFKLKSGRRSPFFINTGNLDNGRTLKALGEAYAQAIDQYFGTTSFDVVFGPAYKGIPLAAATAIGLDNIYLRVLRYCSNRKEPKDHGDVGNTIGSKLHDADRVLIVDDVLTTGSSIYEAKEFLEPYHVQIIGALVAIDRHEHGEGDRGQLAIDEVSEKCGFPVKAIATMPELSQFFAEVGILTDETIIMKLDRYYDFHGAKQL